MTEKSKILWVYLLTALFLVVNFYLVLQKDVYWLFLLPIALVILFYYLISLDKILLFITFLTPFAVELRGMEGGLGVSLPTEPLMFGVLLIFVANLLLDKRYDRKAAIHPISYIIYTSLFWMFFTSMTSEIPLVSFKYLLSRLWFVVPFYFVAVLMFKKKSNIKKFLMLYMLSLSIIVIYTIIQHSKYGFSEEAGHWVMSPFYNDHTAYGAILAMFLPIGVGFIFYPSSTKKERIFSFILLSIMVTGITLSYGRAAWISVLAAAGVFILIKLRIKFYIFAITLIFFAGTLFVFQNQILDKLSKNKQDSSGNISEHVQSISNITSDASNLERINRWQAAIRLFEERPIVGWGPGTYQFVYSPYQSSQEKTIISTNLGDKGNAHSEYLGSLADMGIPGMVLVILLVIFVITTGLRVYKNGDINVRYLSLMALLGLITYFTHGFLNNFLDTDKLSVPFWGFIAILVALDTYHIPQESLESSVEEKIENELE
ncbi:MAG: O-antigen ligase family protein [Bacteroidota bacterium]